MISMPAFSFSHTRGTPPKEVGRTPASAPASAVMSASGATCMPVNIGQ